MHIQDKKSVPVDVRAWSLDVLTTDSAAKVLHGAQNVFI